MNILLDIRENPGGYSDYNEHGKSFNIHEQLLQHCTELYQAALVSCCVLSVEYMKEQGGQ